MKPILIVLIGLSGVGKSTLRDYSIKMSELKIKKLIAITTRIPRTGEINGVDKYFVNIETLQRLQQEGSLCEVKEIYGNYYAFYKHDLCLNENELMLAELHYDAYPAFKQQYNAIGIYIKPDNYNVMIRSLLHRGSSQEEYDLRSSELSKDILALDKMEKNNLFNYTFTNHRRNDDLEKFVKLLDKIVEDYSC